MNLIFSLHPQWMTPIPLTYQETHARRLSVNGTWLPCFLSKCSTVTLELQVYCVTKKHPQLDTDCTVYWKCESYFLYLLQGSWLGVEVQQKEKTVQESIGLIWGPSLSYLIYLLPRVGQRLHGRYAQEMTVIYLLEISVVLTLIACVQRKLAWPLWKQIHQVFHIFKINLWW